MKRKYPFKMFLFGIVLNFVFHFFYLLVPGVVLCLLPSQNLRAIGAAMLLLDLILSIIEQCRIRRAVLSDSDNEEFNQIMDTFYGESTEDGAEEDAESAQRQALLEKLVVYRTLRDSVKEGMTLDELIAAFEKMCELDVGEPDDLLFETGTFNFTGKNLFYFTLVRQFQFLDDDEFVQLHLDITCDPCQQTRRLHRTHWGDVQDATFFQTVRTSREYTILKDLPFRVDVRVEDT